MQQIDQDPSGYRFQKPDGSWGQRVDKKLCRWLGIVVIALLAFMAWKNFEETGDFTTPAVFGFMAFAAGALITLSLKSID